MSCPEPGVAPRFARDDARETGTILSRPQVRGYRRPAERRTARQVPIQPGGPNELGDCAAIRRTLGERGIDLPDA